MDYRKRVNVGGCFPIWKLRVLAVLPFSCWQKVEAGKAKKNQKSKEAESGGDLGSVRADCFGLHAPQIQLLVSRNPRRSEKRSINVNDPHGTQSGSTWSLNGDFLQTDGLNGLFQIIPFPRISKSRPIHLKSWFEILDNLVLFSG